MLGKNKKIKEESLFGFSFSNIISKKLILSQTYCDLFQIKIINEKNEYLMKEIQCENKIKEEEIKKEIFLLKRINSTVEKPNAFMKFYGYAIVEDTFNLEKIYYLFFDLVSESLYTLIKKRKSKKMRFTFAEIYSAYKALLNSFTYLQLRGMRHGKISPQNIFLEYEDELSFCSFKICDINSSETSKSQSNIVLEKNIVQSELKYISPEFRNSSIKCDLNLFKVDVFAMGILLLEMCTFDFPTNLDYKEGEFSIVETNELKDELSGLLKDVRRNYRDKIKPFETKKFELFLELLSSMISLDFNIRPDFQELYKASIFMSEEDLINHMLIEEKRYIIEGSFHSSFL